MVIEDLPRMRPLSPGSASIVPDPKRLKVMSKEVSKILRTRTADPCDDKRTYKQKTNAAWPRNIAGA